MATNDPIEWILKDTDLSTDLGILPLGPSKLYLQLNEPGSGEVKVPGVSRAAQMATSQMFLEGYYRGDTRGGFFVENLSQVDVDASEGAGQWLSMTGRGALAILEDAIVWTDGTSKTKRTFDTATKASILIDLIEEAKARGCFPDISYDFSATQDSLGNYWTDAISLELSVGTSLLEVVRDFTSMGMDMEMLVTGGGYLLKAYRDGKGSDKSASLYFRVGVNCEEVSRQELGGSIKNALLVRYEDGYTRVYDTPSIAARRRREKLLEADYAGNSSVAATFGRAELEQVADPQKSIAVKIYDGIGPRAFVDYDLGDYITLDVGGTQTEYRIRGLQLEWNGGKVADVIVDLNSTIMENELKMAKDIRDLQDRWASAHDAGALDATFWAAIGEPNDINEILCIAVSGSLVYVGGKFTTIGNVAANNIAVYNIESSSWSALGSGLDDACSDIVIIGSTVYACGEFLNAGGVSASHVAAWNGTAWSALGSGVSPNPYTMAAYGTDLLVAGNIATMTNFVVKRWNGSAWSILGGEVDGKVRKVAVNGSDVYIGGEFTSSGTTILNGVAKLSGDNWVALGSGAVGGDVLAIAFMGSDVYIGGSFTVAGGGPGDHVAVWDGTNWQGLGNGVDGLVRALACSTVDVFVGGDFLNASGVPANYIAKFNGESWEALGAGLNAMCRDIEIYNMMDIYVGGGFTTAGDTPASRVAAYLTTFESIMDYMENASGYHHPNHSGHVHSVGDGATTIQPNVVANTMLTDMDASTLKGRPQGAGTGDPVDLTPTQARLLLNVEDGAEVNNISDADALELTGGGETELHSHAGGSGTWGSITGDLADQTDLQTALGTKLDSVLAALNAILFTDGSGNVGGASDFTYDPTYKSIWLGGNIPAFTATAGVSAIGDLGIASRFRSILYRDLLSAAGGLTTARSGGTMASPTKVLSGMLLGQWAVLGTYDTSGTFASANAAIYAYADADWSSTSRPVRWEIYVTPSGSPTATLAVTIAADGTVTLGSGGMNIPSGKTYNINGSPHAHDALYAAASHAARHKSGGADAIKLDELAAPTDVTTLNATTSAHGLLPKATAPASGLLNVLGIANGETVWSAKAIFDNTNPAALGTAGPGTATLAARRDHVHEKQTVLLPWGVYAGVGPFSGDAVPYAASGGYTMTLVNLVCGFFVATTNNGSNYWSITIDSKPSGTTIKTLTTASASPNVFTSVSSALSGTVASSDTMIRVVLTKVGSPGNIYFASPNLEVKI